MGHITHRLERAEATANDDFWWPISQIWDVLRCLYQEPEKLGWIISGSHNFVPRLVPQEFIVTVHCHGSLSRHLVWHFIWPYISEAKGVLSEWKPVISSDHKISSYSLHSTTDISNLKDGNMTPWFHVVLYHAVSCYASDCYVFIFCNGPCFYYPEARPLKGTLFDCKCHFLPPSWLPLSGKLSSLSAGVILTAIPSYLKHDLHIVFLAALPSSVSRRNYKLIYKERILEQKGGSRHWRNRTILVLLLLNLGTTLRPSKRKLH